MAVNYLSTIFCCKIGITDKEYMEEAMSSVQLLDKTRKIGKLLHNNNSSKVVFNDICDVMTDILASNVLVISKKGKVLGTGLRPEVVEITELLADQVGNYIDASLNERLLGWIWVIQWKQVCHWMPFTNRKCPGVWLF